MAGGGAGQEEERIYRMGRGASATWSYSHVLRLSLATVISEEFPAICVQSNSLTDLGLLVNIGRWPERTEGVLCVFVPSACWSKLLRGHRHGAKLR